MANLKTAEFNWRAALAFLHDVLASGLCWLLAFWLRFNLDIPEEFEHPLLLTVMVSMPSNAVLFWYFGLYRGTWRYASLPDLQRILLVCVIGALAVPAFLVLLREADSVLRSAFIFAPVMLAVIMGGNRFAYRVWKERMLYGHVQLQGEPVKIADLARDMIRLSGFAEEDIRIEFTGLRPGEKLYEEPLSDTEKTLPTPHPKLRIARANEAPQGAWLGDLEQWLASTPHDAASVKENLSRWVPEYRRQ